MLPKFVEVTSQAELDALPADAIAVVRQGYYSYDSATVRAYDSATVRAYDSATVRAYDSATVRAYDSATVEATPFVAIHKFPRHTGKLVGGVIINVPNINECDAATWLDYYGITSTDGTAILYKAVNDDHQTGRGSEWTYAPGNTVTADDFDPARVCGWGLHLCATPWQSAQYLPTATRYVAVEVDVDSIVTLGDKVKVRSCRVLHEVTRDGEAVQS